MTEPTASPNPIPVALVTGDVILDENIYVGTRLFANSPVGVGTRSVPMNGGAEVASEMLKAFAKSELKFRKEEAGKKLREEGKLSEEEITAGLDSNEPAFEVRSGFEGDLGSSLSANLKSFAVWKPFPQSPEASQKVWRNAELLGYGCSGRACNVPLPTDWGHEENLLKSSDVALFDDAALGYRRPESNHAWPAWLRNSDEAGEVSAPNYIVLKMASPLATGDLWSELSERFGEQLIVVVSAEELRRDEAGISQGLSWEKTASDLLRELEENPTAKKLHDGCRDLIVTFRSAGALWIRSSESEEEAVLLVFDPKSLEGEVGNEFDGGGYGYQSVFCACLVRELLLSLGEKDLAAASQTAIESGIRSGLVAKRELRWLGHGTVGTGEEPKFPYEPLAERILHGGRDHVSARLTTHWRSDPRSLLEIQHRERVRDPQPFYGLGMVTARYGIRALSRVPRGQFGALFTVDRSEIESLRTIKSLIEEYERERKQKKPLSIAAFGAPGSGKSFGVKQISRAILGKEVPLLEFNLSQFSGPEELIGAFHQVRDEVLKGKTPVVFWDEFDSREYFWLQYLLAPMQDGLFQEGQVTHSIGKCIFIFAGGTSYTLENFGPPDPSSEEYQELKIKGPELASDQEAYHEFRLRKGPDFVSRLHGFINVLGPNPRHAYDLKTRQWVLAEKLGQNRDLAFPVRRALMLRALLRIEPHEELQIDSGLLAALIQVDEFRHGARSLEKLIKSVSRRGRNEIHRSNLPPGDLLDREVDREAFEEIMKRSNRFKTHPDIEKMAAAVHEFYRELGRKEGWLSEALDCDYESLDPENRRKNVSAAERIPNILELIDLFLVPEESEEKGIEEDRFRALIEANLDQLAEAEHLGWQADMEQNGWVYGETRNNEKRTHPSICEFGKLSEKEQSKDRSAVEHFPDIITIAKYEAVRNPAIS